jgi:ABC-type transport system involved in multi-copper enzyme maturation permease subunit
MTTRRLTAVMTLTFVLLGSLFIYSFVEGDNTLIGLVRVLLTWSFSFISGLLMLLVLYFSSTVLDAEMVGRQIYLLDVKPVPRWKILAGKWTGLAIVAGGLMLGMGGLTYGALRWLAREPAVSARAEAPAPGAAEEAGSAAPSGRVQDEIFVSRSSWRPRLTHANRLVEEQAEDLRKRGRVDAETAASPAFRKLLLARLEERVPPIAFESSRAFTFVGLPPPDAGSPDLYIRYKLRGRRGREPELHLHHAWELGHSGAAPPGAPPRAPLRRTLSSTAGVSKEFRIGAAAIGPDGTLHLSLTNLMGADGDAPAAELLVPSLDDIELLVPTGSFEMNFLRGLLLLWIRICMLAAIGIAANTFLRGRVTAFLLLGLILTGSLNSFVHSVVAPEATGIEILQGDHAGHDHSGDDTAHARQHESEGAGKKLIDVWTTTVVPVLFGILPDFAATDPVPDLLVGREIGWGRVATQACLDVGVRAGLVWLIGLYCFYRKEVGLPVTD